MLNISNSTGSESTLGDRQWFMILKNTIYCVIFLISLVGNGMVCYVVCRRMKLKSVTNYFIMNLALSDLLYTLLVPFDVFAAKTWPYGSFVCRILWPSQTLAITVSGFTLTALSVTRFWAVVHPLRRQLSVTESCIVIFVLWILATSTVIPYIYYLRYYSSTKKCEEEWPVFKQRQIYTASLLVVQYAIPLMIISACYLRIGFELTRNQTKTYNRMLAKARGKEAKKVIKMLVIVTLAFAVLTLPSAIMWMWLDFGQADQKFSSFWDVIDVLNIFDFLNCASNPIIYSFCNESFSREFRRQLGCILPSPPPSESCETGKFTVPAGSSSPSGTGHTALLRTSVVKDCLSSEESKNCATLL